MYIVIGASGFFGSYILINLLDLTKEDIIAVARHSCNICNKRIKWKEIDIECREQVNAFLEEVNMIESKKIIFLAAYHNPDLVENNKKHAWNINITSLSYIVNGLNYVKKFVYVSTDCVYGESSNNKIFCEDDQTDPINEYGRQKKVAEQVVLGYGYNVARFPFLIGHSLVENKNHFYDKIVEDLNNSKAVEMFVDSYRSSLDFDSASILLIKYVESDNNNTPALLNICGDKALSKYDIGCMIAKDLGMDQSLIIPVNFVGIGIFKTKRAQSIIMDNTKMKRLFDLTEVSIKIGGVSK